MVGSSLVIHCSLIYLTLFIFNLPVIYKVSQSVKLLLTQRLYKYRSLVVACGGERSETVRPETVMLCCCVCAAECQTGVCSRCGCAVYCSKPCQARDWPSHKAHCQPHLLKLSSSPERGGTGVTASEHIRPGTRCFSLTLSLSHSLTLSHSPHLQDI